MTLHNCDFCNFDIPADQRAETYTSKSSGFDSSCCLWRDKPDGPTYLVVDTDLWLSDRANFAHLAESDESMVMQVHFCPQCGLPLDMQAKSPTRTAGRNPHEGPARARA